MSDLMPCPAGCHVGQLAIVGVQMRAVQCAMCGWAGPFRPTKADAIAAWNRRTVQAQTDAAVTVQEAIEAAYIAGAMDVHQNWQADRAPDFSEAARDYSASQPAPVAAPVTQDAALILAKEMQMFVAADRWKGRDLSATPPEKWHRLRSEVQQFWIDEATRILAALAQPSPVAAPVTDAVRDVLAERQRQITEEGFTPEHDDAYQAGDLSNAAACYLMTDPVMDPDRPAPVDWPWSATWWKPTSRRRNLVKGIALGIAELERLDRTYALATHSEPVAGAAPPPWPVGLIHLTNTRRFHVDCATEGCGRRVSTRFAGSDYCEPCGREAAALAQKGDIHE